MSCDSKIAFAYQLGEAIVVAKRWVAATHCSVRIGGELLCESLAVLPWGRVNSADPLDAESCDYCKNVTILWHQLGGFNSLLLQQRGGSSEQSI